MYVRVSSQLSTRNVYVPGLAISVNGGGVILAVHGHSDSVASLHILANRTGDGHVGLRLGLVDHIVASNGVDGNRSFRQIGIDTVATVSFSRSGVTCSVFGLNLGVYVRILGQFSTRNVHVPGLAIGINGGRVILTVDRHGHRVTGLHILANRTSDGHVRLGLSLVDHVVTGNGVDRDRSFGQIGIDTVAAVGFSTGWVARSIFSLNLGVYTAVLGQFGTRNVYVPGLAIGINGGGVVLTVDRHGHGITGLNVFTHGTSDGHVGLGLSLVDHVVTRNGVDGNRSFWQVGIDTVATVSFSRSGVTGGVFRFHLGVNIAVLSQFGTRNVHVPGLAVSVNGGGVILTVDRHGHGIASLNVFTHGTGDGHVGLGLSLVDHVVARNGVDGDGGFRSIGINIVWTFCIGGSGVACFVLSRNLSVNFSVTQQVHAWNIHVPRLAIGINRCSELFTTDSDSDGVAGLDVLANRTGDGHVGFGLGLVNDVIFSDDINSDLGFRRRNVDIVRLLVGRSRGVAGVVGRGDFGFNLVVVDQLGTRNVHAPGLAVRIDGGFVFFTADSHSDLVARFDVFTNRTGDRNVAARLFLVDHVVACDRINFDLGFRRRNVDVVRLLVGRSRGVAGVVGRGDFGFNLVVVDQFGTRNVHAPGLAVRIDGGFVFFTADGHSDLVARFDVFTNRTGDRDVAARLFLVDHVVACDRIDFDLGFRRRNVDVVRLLVGRSRGVASVVGRGDFGFNLVVVDQLGTRNVHAPGLAVRVDGGFVFFIADGHSDLVARFDVFTNRTSNSYITFGLFLIDDAVFSNGIDRDFSFWGQRVDRGRVFAAVTWGANFVGVATVRHFDGDFTFVVRWGNQRSGPGLGIFVVWCQTFDATAAGDHDIFDIKAKWHFSKCEGNGAVVIDLDSNGGRNQRTCFFFASTAVATQAHVFNGGHARTWVFQGQRACGFHNADQAGEAAATAFATTGQYGSGWVKLGEWIIASFQSGQHSRNGWVVRVGQSSGYWVHIGFCDIAADQEGAVIGNGHRWAARDLKLDAGAGLGDDLGINRDAHPFFDSYFGAISGTDPCRTFNSCH
ncbi:hypothetical protein ACI0FW_03863 [Alcaligenes nematophilus]